MKKVMFFRKLSFKLLITNAVCLFLSLFSSYWFTYFVIAKNRLQEKYNVDLLFIIVLAFGITVYISVFLLIVNRNR